MRLPSLSVIIAVQAVFWCIAGAAIHGWMILLYPAVWLTILGAFAIHHVTHPLNAAARRADKVHLENRNWNNPLDDQSVPTAAQ